jgi:RNA polymerase sigma-70 factor (ECF subfamily)
LRRAAQRGWVRELSKGMAEPLHNSAALAGPFRSRLAQDADRSRRVAAPVVTPEEVFRLVYRQVRKLAGRRDVDDLAQSAAEQAIRALPSFAGRSELSTWTFRICYLTILKHDRWYRRWLRRFAFTHDGELPEPATDADALDERLVSRERGQRLGAALAQLSAKRRAVVILHDLEGLSIDEIAQVTGALPRAIRSRLRDGRNALAEIVEKDPYFGVEACRREGEP